MKGFKVLLSLCLIVGLIIGMLNIVSPVSDSLDTVATLMVCGCGVLLSILGGIGNDKDKK